MKWAEAILPYRCLIACGTSPDRLPRAGAANSTRQTASKSLSGMLAVPLLKLLSPDGRIALRTTRSCSIKESGARHPTCRGRRWAPLFRASMQWRGSARTLRKCLGFRARCSPLLPTRTVHSWLLAQLAKTTTIKAKTQTPTRKSTLRQLPRQPQRQLPPLPLPLLLLLHQHPQQTGIVQADGMCPLHRPPPAQRCLVTDARRARKVTIHLEAAQAHKIPSALPARLAVFRALA